MLTEAESQVPQMEPSGAAPSWPRRIVDILFTGILLLAVAWGTLAIYYSNLPSPLAGLAALAYGAGGFAALIFVKPRWRGKLTGIVMFIAVLAWWWTIPPSQQRNWRKDVATLPYADSSGTLVTVHNIRNCVYRSETDYDVRYYDKTVDLARLESVDMYFVHWGSPAIAHTMMSFGFGGNQFICFSIETRCEAHEGYSSIKGFFKQFELICLAADERDVVRLRTNYRKEDVYLYRLRAKPEVVRALFLRYCHQMNELRARPAWYNALTRNCTTAIPTRDGNAPRGCPRTWKVVLPGYLPGWIYEQQVLDTSLPFAELQKRSRINERAQAADQDPNFSLRIREGLPKPEARR
jgi:hypothetical protein